MPLDTSNANGWTGGQFSLVRSVLGAYLLAELARHGALMTFDSAGGEAGRGFLLAAAAWVGAALAGALALGWQRWSAAGLWAVLTLLAIGVERYPLTGSDVPPSARVLLGIAALVMLVIALLPAAPFGSWPARWRHDPGGGWRFPRSLFLAMWMVVAGMFLLWGVLLVPDLGWRVAERGMRLGAFGHMFASELSIAANWFLLGSWLALAPLALTRTTRPVGWLLVLMANVIVLPLAGYGFLAPPLVMLSLLTFDPGWLPRRAGERETIFYDGQCGLCHRAVRFVLAEDPGGEVFELSPQQGEHFAATVPRAQRERLPDAIVLRRADGTLLTRSAAALAILDGLGGWWRVLARVGGAVPAPLRDAVYDAIARVRFKLFAPPAELCPITPPHLRERFRQ